MSAAGQVAIVGGGLAGLAAAAVLAERGVGVELFEAKRRLGGRTASFQDATTGEKFDHCQHVSMDCCTNLAHFARRVGIGHLFRPSKKLTFIDPSRAVHRLAAANWLPAPLHLLPSFARLAFFSGKEKRAIARALLALARSRTDGFCDGPTIGQWLRGHDQSDEAIERFWGVVLTSALGETVEKAGVHYARKVFVDAFLTNRRGYVVETPKVPLDDIYGTRLEQWLATRGATIHLSSPVSRLIVADGIVHGVELRGGRAREFRSVVVAAPWRRTAELLRASNVALDIAENLDRLEPSPISAVHLWFDRPITDLPHAALVGRRSQWIFQRGPAETRPCYYQVVISASRELESLGREQVVDCVVRELQETFPTARDAVLERALVVTDPESVFSPVPGVDRWRPMQKTLVPGLFVAGDWTATGWPATMEGAVRSGHLAAAAVLGVAESSFLAPPLSRSLLASALLAGRH